MGRLEGKVAIVTGAGSGIGEATARLMAHEGASVVVVDSNGTQAQRVAGEIGPWPSRSTSQRNRASCAWSRGQSRPTAAWTCCTTMRPTPRRTPPTPDIVTLDMAVFDRLVAVNLKGMFLGCEHAIPRMLARGGGSITNTASIEAFVGRGVRAAYAASKAGIVSLARSVASQFGSRGIRCNAVAPGLGSRPEHSITHRRSRSRLHWGSIRCRDSAGRRMWPTSLSSSPRTRPLT